MRTESFTATGAAKPVARVLAERIISILEESPDGPDPSLLRQVVELLIYLVTGRQYQAKVHYFYLSPAGQLVPDGAGAVRRVGISRRGSALPEVSALTEQIESLLDTLPDPNLQLELL